MKEFDIQSKLSAYCHYGWDDKLRKLLDEHIEKLDLLSREGELFCTAARFRPQVLKILLEYYTKYNLGGSPESYEYKLAKFKLMDVVDYIFDSDISDFMTEEVKELLAPYRREQDESSILEEDLDEAGVDHVLLRDRVDSEDRRSEEGLDIQNNEGVVIGLENIIQEHHVGLMGVDD